MEWQPIEMIATRDEVLLYNEETGRMRVGVADVFDGIDGITRRGRQQGLGIWIATHWMPLPDPPVNLIVLPDNIDGVKSAC